MSITAMALICLASCGKHEEAFDASGSFEAVETIISSEASGRIEKFDIEEGQQLKATQYIGYIDSTQLYLKMKQMETQIGALLSKKPKVSLQLAALHEQLKAAQVEQKRVHNLVKADAATPKQGDDADAQVHVLQAEIAAQKSSLNISSEGISQDANPLQVQIQQLNDQLQKCKLINPIEGTVLTKYAEVNETTAPGQPLYKIADLSTIILRAYISGNQLPVVKINQKVTVLTDDGNGAFKKTSGIITWINNKAEFTPKTIQTKDERANMVYAIKVRVTNDGTYKIGMYGEVKF